MKRLIEYFKRRKAMALVGSGFMLVGIALAIMGNPLAAAGVMSFGVGLNLRDMSENEDTVVSIVPAVYTATATGVGVDLRGYDAATVIFATGAIVAAGLFTPKIQESSDSTNGSDGTWNDVAAADQVQPTALANLAASASQRVGYIGSKRWVRAVATYVSGTSTAISASVMRGRPHVRPLA